MIVEKLKFICPPTSTPGVGVIRKHSFSRPDLQEKKKSTDEGKLNEYIVYIRVLCKKISNITVGREVPGTGPFQLGMWCQEESNSNLRKNLF